MNDRVTKFEYIFDTAFSVKSNNAIEDLTPKEIADALMERAKYLRNNLDEVFEAVGDPSETVINEESEILPVYLTIHPHPEKKSNIVSPIGPYPYLNFGPRDLKVRERVLHPILQMLSEGEIEKGTELQNFVIFVPEQVLEECPSVLEDLVKKNIVIILGDVAPSYGSPLFDKVWRNSSILKHLFEAKGLFLYPQLEEVFISLHKLAT